MPRPRSPILPAGSSPHALGHFSRCRLAPCPSVHLWVAPRASSGTAAYRAFQPRAGRRRRIRDLGSEAGGAPKKSVLPRTAPAKSMLHRRNGHDGNHERAVGTRAPQGRCTVACFDPCLTFFSAFFGKAGPSDVFSEVPQGGQNLDLRQSAMEGEPLPK